MEVFFQGEQGKLDSLPYSAIPSPVPRFARTQALIALRLASHMPATQLINRSVLGF